MLSFVTGTRLVALLMVALCLSCGEATRPLPELNVRGNLECLPWLDDGPAAIEENLVEVLTDLGVEGIDGLEILALNGGGGWVWSREVVDAYYIFIYSIKNEAGEDELGASGITIDLSSCEFTLMAPRSVE